MENKDEPVKSAANYLADNFKKVLEQHKGRPDATYKATVDTLNVAAYLLDRLRELVVEAEGNAARTRLTVEERDALYAAAQSYGVNDDDEECCKISATLRGLLARTS